MIYNEDFTFQGIQITTRITQYSYAIKEMSSAQMAQLVHDEPLEALQTLEKLLAKYPAHPIVTHWLHSTYEKLNTKESKRKRILLESYKLYPDYLPTRISYTYYCIDNNNLDEIPEVFNSWDLAKLYPEKIFSLYEVINFYHLASRYFFEIDHFDESEKYLSYLRELDPHNSAQLNKIEEIIGAARRYGREAIREAALNNDPLGDYQYDGMTISYEEPISKYSIEGLNKSALNDMIMDDPRKAISILQEYLEEYPEHPIVSALLSFAIFHIDKNAAAVDQLLIDSYKVYPDYLTTMNAYAQKCFSEDNFDEIPKIYKNTWHLKRLFPKQKVFYFIDVVTFYQNAFFYFLEMCEFETAQTYLTHYEKVQRIPDKEDIEELQSFLDEAKEIHDTTHCDDILLKKSFDKNEDLEN